ncbi:MAG: hypothetical protein ACK58N_11410 [Synechocystis sp.]|jgi:hypothetical protein
MKHKADEFNSVHFLLSKISIMVDFSELLDENFLRNLAGDRLVNGEARAREGMSRVFT